MNDIAGVSNNPLAAGSSSSAELASINFDTFIKLLATQLQNQDPLNPMDGTAFTEQIATFASLEQQIATNSHLEGLLQQQSYGAQTLAVSYIGKEVLIPSTDAVMVNGQMEFSYKLDKPATVTEITIVDSTGTTVASFEGERTAGVHDNIWDGRDASGKQLPDGIYNIFVSAVNEDGTILTQTYAYAGVNGVEGNAQNVVLRMDNGNESQFDDVLRVREAARGEQDIAEDSDNNDDETAS